VREPSASGAEGAAASGSPPQQPLLVETAALYLRPRIIITTVAIIFYVRLNDAGA
jgi:hypothetical protein